MAMNPLTLEGENRAKQRRQMIKDALQEKNPQLFRQLRKSARLEEFVRDREKEMMLAYSEGWNKALYHHIEEKNAKENPLEQVKEFEASLRSLWEEILATYLEF
ncbi:MAG: hypothetical protein CVU57_16265 [Deltaproteobacteria bacterium HGW-Deltaproteobacteria-15]|jgi:nicotinamide mononucleotide adenylyltransferase|nr:MAG: hypothetical protein CVU57_16265 [Deltaproteobacteria bacterium HGW-Deltaproteobacteria-15]